MSALRHPHHGLLLSDTEGQRQVSSRFTPALRLLTEFELRLGDMQCLWEATDHIELAHVSEGASNLATTTSFHISSNLLLISAF
jgi:hypothetical protein